MSEDKHYVAHVLGWMTVVKAQNKTQAVMEAKALAPSASLLKSDVTASNVRLANEDEIAWYLSMGGNL